MSRRARRIGSLGLLLAGWAAGAGCSCHLHSVHPVPEDLAQVCDCIAPCGRNHVYTFFVQGVDPLDCANLEGVKEYVQSLGFHRAWFGHWFHVHKFADEIVRISQDDPDARFVIVGVACGTDAGRKLAEAVGGHGICVDLLVCLDSDPLAKGGAGRPENVQKVITILTSDRKGKSVAHDAEEVYLAEGGVFAAATNPGTLEVLARELATLAGSFPAPEDHPKAPFPCGGPTSRPSTAKAPDERDDWDFLKPTPVDTRPAPPAPPPQRGRGTDHDTSAPAFSD
jgi:hypothetical protein